MFRTCKYTITAAAAVLLIFVTGVNAQSLQPTVIGTLGGYSAPAGSASLSYNMGETIVSTFQSGSSMLTQGFEQPVYVGPVSGAMSLCPLGTTTLTDGTTGGTWSSGNLSVAAVGASTGVVTGVASGTANITYAITGGASVVTVTVNPLPGGGTISGTSSVTVGTNITLSDATTGGVWASGATSIATVNATGAITGIAAGSVTISYSVTNSCGTASATKVITVNSTGVAAITGTAHVCIGSVTAVTDATVDGTWSSSTTTVATVATTGTVTGVAAGTTTISYTISGGYRSTLIITVNAAPAAISGTASMCTGLTTTLTDVTTGGTWSTTSGSNASIGTTTSGVITGVSAGTAVISYTLPSGCYKTDVVTVNQAPSAITVSSGYVCVGAATGLSDGISGGTWASSLTTVATVATTGTVTGVTAGTATISYTLGACRSTTIITVDAVPAAISGTTSVCTGLTTTLIDATTGGTWSTTSGGNASLGTTSSGLAMGVSAGTAVISYRLPSGCYKVDVVTVNQSPAGITGANAVCLGLTTILSDVISGGTWASSAAYATITAAGVVNTVGAGVTTISYTLAGSCRSTLVLTVDAVPVAISGTASVCMGATTTMTDATAGGTWSTTSGGSASIGTTSSGVTMGVSVGTAVVTYKLASGCYKTDVVTVNQSPATITVSIGYVCIGAATGLSDGIGGGTWASSSTAVATIATTGTVTGVAAGTSIISYTLGSCRSTTIITVDAVPVAISGTASVCTGLTTTLTDATTGGTWSTTSVTASIGATGSGVTVGVSVGTAVVTYALPSGCYKTDIVTVNQSPATITVSIGYVCIGAATGLSNGIGGGTWASSSTAVATIATTGTVTGVAAGTSIISYTLGSCRSTTIITVDAVPAAISGTSSVCAGAATTLTDLTTGGAWSVGSGSSYGTVDPVSGIVTGIAPGSASVTYTLPTSCIINKTVTVNVMPGPITGTFAVCKGLITTLVDGTSGGTWTSSATTVATVGASTGVVSGTSTAAVSAATTITYKITNGGCYVTTGVMVNPLPAAISGTSSVCAGAATTLTDLTTGGAWSVGSGSSYGTIDPVSGIVTGIASGPASITYTLPTSCIITKIVTVNVTPGPITGTFVVCKGLTTTLVDGTTGGTWISSATTVATVGASTGVVTGVSTATVTTITYKITIGGCYATANVTVDAVPVVAAITGATSISHEVPVTLSDATTGGVWSSNNIGIVTVTTGATTTMATAVVTSGMATISYTVTNGFGCAASATHNITAAAAPPSHGSGETSTTGIVTPALSAASIMVYPNPTTGNLTVKVEVKGNFYLYTFDGKELAEYKITERATIINFPNGLAAGVYMGRFAGDDGIIADVKLVYQR